MDYLNEKYSSVPLRRDLSIDEQLCSTKSKNYLKQYLPAKPHKWRCKLYVLSDDKGYSYQFEVYSGQENEARFRLPYEPDIGACAKTS